MLISGGFASTKKIFVVSVICLFITNIGPQKTLYVPASILRQGENEIVLFESDGLKGKPEVFFQDKSDLGSI